MGDRCYMEVTCLRKDMDRFDDLGFSDQDYLGNEDDSLTVSMVDEEANYGHSDEMPTDIPYTCNQGGGGCYGPSEIVCDGVRFSDIQVGHDGGYVVRWDTEKNEPCAEDIERIRQHIEIEAKANEILGIKGKE